MSVQQHSRALHKLQWVACEIISITFSTTYWISFISCSYQPWVQAPSLVLQVQALCFQNFFNHMQILLIDKLGIKSGTSKMLQAPQHTNTFILQSCNRVVLWSIRSLKAVIWLWFLRINNSTTEHDRMKSITPFDSESTAHSIYHALKISKIWRKSPYYTLCKKWSLQQNFPKHGMFTSRYKSFTTC